MGRLRHYRSLDGLRGIAVLIVLFAHASPLYVSGAFGVDVFFVLSGFLITGILERELEQTGTISIRRFYARRVLRLFPALWITLVGVSLAMWLLGKFDQPFLWEVVWAALYVTNWVGALELGEQHFLSHTWSLAIEEQYYLLWPWVLLALYGCRITNNMKAILLLLLAIGVAVYRALSGYSDVRIYQGLDTHCDGLLLGSALAIAHVGGLERFRLANQFVRFIAPAALAVLLVLPGYYGWWHEFTIQYGYSLVALLSAILIWNAASHEQTLLSRMFSLAPLVYFGKISYGIYLYHWPIRLFVIQFYKDYPWLQFLLIAGSSLAIAAISFHFIEKPILGLKDKYFGSINKDS